MRYIDDPVTANVERYFRSVADNVVRNITSGNWDRATRWAELLWAITAAAQGVLWESEDRADA
jgi:hypothetical protein